MTKTHEVADISDLFSQNEQLNTGKLATHIPHTLSLRFSLFLSHSHIHAHTRTHTRNTRTRTHTHSKIHTLKDTHTLRSTFSPRPVFSWARLSASLTAIIPSLMTRRLGQGPAEEYPAEHSTQDTSVPIGFVTR